MGPLFQPAQAEDIVFWCPRSSSNAPQPRFPAVCISGGLLASGHSVLTCIARPGFFLPQASDSPRLLPTWHYTCPLLYRDPARLPSSTWRRRDVGTPAAHPALGLLDLLSPHQLAPTRWSEKHSSSLCFINGILQKKKEEKKKVALHPSKRLGRCFWSTAQATSLLHWSQGAPASPGFESRQQRRRTCAISSCPGFTHPGLCSASSQPNYRSDTNSTDRGGDPQPGLRSICSQLTRERRIHAQALPG